MNTSGQPPTRQWLTDSTAELVADGHGETLMIGRIREAKCPKLKLRHRVRAMRIRSAGVLIALTLLGVTGCESTDGQQLSAEGAAIAAIKALGGEFRLEHTVLDLSKAEITDRELEHLKQLTSLVNLRLSHTQVTDEGLKHLNALKDLKSLRLAETHVTDAGLEQLKGLSSLEFLELSDTEVSGPGLQHLKVLSSLRFLLLANTPITDASLEHLKSLSSLEQLNLADTLITEAGFEELNSALGRNTVERD